MINFDQVHKELARHNVTLSLLHYEYEVDCRTNGKIPYAYRSFLRHYKSYADKYKETLCFTRFLCKKRSSGQILGLKLS